MSQGLLDALPDEFVTSIEGLTLRLLEPGDADACWALVQANRGHLTRHGDFTEQVGASRDEVRAAFEGPPDPFERAYGIRLHGELVGQISLIAANPPHYGLGCWLAESATGKGYARAACEALFEQARTVLAATDIFAGVTHGNTSSVALVRRLGFTPVAAFDTYTRFQKSL
ncbi:GNAT family N-acetyltransferase [Spirillospora sp. CA-294931]|uniref:GNAT family N-acetyltransferase n=1 Tax=Spirillospora sp. CA-294931 TaxID=3240042 RepID=UPI003D94612D